MNGEKVRKESREIDVESCVKNRKKQCECVSILLNKRGDQEEEELCKRGE